MTFARKLFTYAAMTALRQNTRVGAIPFLHKPAAPAALLFDPELLYVECQQCKSPVVWDTGKTSLLLEASGVDLSLLDEHCLILSDGCPLCKPAAKEGFVLSVVRVASLTPEEAAHMMRPGGNA